MTDKKMMNETWFFKNDECFKRPGKDDISKSGYFINKQIGTA